MRIGWGGVNWLVGLRWNRVLEPKDRKLAKDAVKQSKTLFLGR